MPILVPMSAEELFTVIRDSKTGKVSYLDEISNEVIKHGIDLFEKHYYQTVLQNWPNFIRQTDLAYIVVW